MLAIYGHLVYICVASKMSVSFVAVSVTFPANGRPSDPAVPDFLTFSATLVWVCHTLGAGNFKKIPENFWEKRCQPGEIYCGKKGPYERKLSEGPTHLRRAVGQAIF